MREISTIKKQPVLHRLRNTSPVGKTQTGAQSHGSPSKFIGELEISIHNNLVGLETAWRKLEKNSDISIYQRFDWINTCINTYEHELKSRVLIVTVKKNAELVFILPMAVQNGLVRKLRWIGGGHSNFNLPLIDREFAKYLDDDGIREIFSRFSRMLPGIGYLRLCCQPAQWNGNVNPLLALTHQPSTNNAFSLDISRGFAHLLESVNGKRKQKKYRSQLRIVEPLGGAELIEAGNRNEVLQMLKCFHQQKSNRLLDQGLRDVFGSKFTHLFFEQMALDSLDLDEPLLKLYALKIDGKYRAIFGGGVQGKHFSAYFTSFAQDELAHISPGEMLLYRLLEKLARDGFDSVDLGGGEERYKRSWCPNTIDMFDVIMPLSIYSHGHVLAHKISLVAKRNLRENPRIWKFFKRTRAGANRLHNLLRGK